ncbi:hypothetical protein DB35_06110, partial [Streptomyces abyssalis]
AVPGAPSSTVRSIAEEILSIARSELPGMDARIGYVEGDGEEYPTLGGVLTQTAADQQAAEERAAELAAVEAAEEAAGSGRPEPGAGAEAPRGPKTGAEERLVALVIPLLAGPDAAGMRQIRQAVLSSGTGAELTDVLGPHPLLAEGVHVKLSEAGLARADRARLFTVATAADGIILASVGGEEAVQAAGITGMLLAARLAVPVLAAGLDEAGAVARVAAQLRESGSQQLAVAPCLIGPEVPEGLLDAAAAEAGCAVAEPLGAYPAVGKLVASTYAAKLGITQQQSPQGMAAR